MLRKKKKKNNLKTISTYVITSYEHYNFLKISIFNSLYFYINIPKSSNNQRK